MKNENVDYFSIFNDDFPKCDQNTMLRKNRSEKWKDMSSNGMSLQVDKAKKFTIDQLSDEIFFCENIVEDTLWFQVSLAVEEISKFHMICVS